MLVTGTAPAAAQSASSIYSEDAEEQREEELSKKGSTRLQHILNWHKKKAGGRNTLKKEEL